MTRYRHKSLPNIEVDADRVGQDTYAPLAHRLGAHVVKEVNKETEETFIGLNVLTSSGWMRASEGDWVVDSAVGIFILSDSHFSNVYEKIDTSADAGTNNLFKQRGGKVNGE